MSSTTTASSNRGGGGRIAGIVLVSIGGLIGLLIMLGGLAAIGAHAFLRDDDGYYTTDTESFASRGYAITSEDVDLGRESVGIDIGELNTSVKFTGESRQPLFLGIGPSTDVARYLAGVPYSQVDDLHERGPTYTQIPGRSAPRKAPGAQSFWAASSAGAGTQTVDFGLESGNWTVVAMNADGSRGVAFNGEAGAKLSWLLWAGLGVFIVGLVIFASCAYAVYRLSGGRGEPSAPPPPPAPPAPQ
jgi:hypothetical protein